MYELKVSIVIVNYNVKYFLEQCLYSVRAAMSGIDAEVFVVDNHSTDGSIEYLRPKFPEVVFIENQDNLGFSKANNLAIGQSRGEYVLLLNPDTVIGKNGLRSLCSFMDNNPESGGVGVKMIDGYGRFLPESKRSFPSPWVSFCRLSGLSRLFPMSRKFSHYNLLYLDENKTHQVDVLSGAFMLLRHNALDKIGLLDETFFMYGEDIDLSYRLILGGYKNYYIPERILHYKGESTKHGDIKYIKAFYGAMLIFFKKYSPHLSWIMSFFIKSAIVLMGVFTTIVRWSGITGKPKRKKRRRLLVVCGKDEFESMKVACAKYAIEFESVDFRKSDEAGAYGSEWSGQKDDHTDVAFCYPTVSFERMLLLMDETTDKEITYHIYNKESGRLVSPGK